VARQGVRSQGRSGCPSFAPHRPALPPDLAAVVAAWPGLPEPIRAGILAMVRAASVNAPDSQDPQEPHGPRRKGDRRPTPDR
jgi:hypothetical protein